jgi:hypothetical protein
MSVGKFFFHLQRASFKLLWALPEPPHIGFVFAPAGGKEGERRGREEKRFALSHTHARPRTKPEKLASAALSGVDLSSLDVFCVFLARPVPLSLSLLSLSLFALCWRVAARKMLLLRPFRSSQNGPRRKRREKRRTKEGRKERRSEIVHVGPGGGKRGGM